MTVRFTALALVLALAARDGEGWLLSVTAVRMSPRTTFTVSTWVGRGQSPRTVRPIRSRSQSSPQNESTTGMSIVESPVTQTAEAEMKSASTQSMGAPS